MTTSIYPQRTMFDNSFQSYDSETVLTEVDVLKNQIGTGIDKQKRHLKIYPETFLSVLERFTKDEKELSFPSSSFKIFNTRTGPVYLVDRITGTDISELNNALRDLREARDEAREEGFPQPSSMALENAERLLREIYWMSPRRFEVYPTPDGEIAIDAPDGQGRSVLLLCDSEGGALCLVNMNGHHRRARYSTTKTLPDGFVREALADLKHQSIQSP